MPGLDLLAEDCDDPVVVFFEERLAERAAVEGLEDFGAERADVVEIDFDSVDCLGLDGA